MECRFSLSLYQEKIRKMSSRDQEILSLQAELEKLQAEKVRLEEESRRLKSEKEQMQGVIDSLQNQMAWLRKKLFGSMTEKRLPMSPSVLEPTLFDMPLPEEEQAALDAEVKKMEEQNTKTIEVKSHKREVRKPVMRRDLPVEENHIYPEGINLEEYTEIGVETTDRIAIRPAVMYIDRTVRHSLSSSQAFRSRNRKNKPSSSLQCWR